MVSAAKETNVDNSGWTHVITLMFAISTDEWHVKVLGQLQLYIIK